MCLGGGRGCPCYRLLLLLLLRLHSLLSVCSKRLLVRSTTVLGHTLVDIERDARPRSARLAAVLVPAFLVVSPLESGGERVPQRRRRAARGGAPRRIPRRIAGEHRVDLCRRGV